MASLSCNSISLYFSEQTEPRVIQESERTCKCIHQHFRFTRILAATVVETCVGINSLEYTYNLEMYDRALDVALKRMVKKKDVCFRNRRGGKNSNWNYIDEFISLILVYYCSMMYYCAILQCITKIN